MLTALSLLIHLTTPAHAAACSTRAPCDVGGYCSSDEHCLSGLLCESTNPLALPTCQPASAPGDWDHCTLDGSCGAGEGDCDSDSECAGGLVCQQDTGARYGWSSRIDTCELPLGDWSRCAPGTPCDEGEGDCDTDSDCLDGLACRQDMGHVYGYASNIDVCAPTSLSCPEDYFSPEELAQASEPRFRLPLETSTANHPLPLGPSGSNWFFDQDSSSNSTMTFEAGHLTYGGHGGTDFMLSASWITLESGSVAAVAAADGVVMDVIDGNPDHCGAGVVSWWPLRTGIVCDGPDPDAHPANLVEVCHPDGTVTEYLHLMDGEMTVGVDDPVACGDPLGLAASSGYSAAPHLHFQVIQDGSLVDPFHADASQSLWVDQGHTWVGLPAETCE